MNITINNCRHITINENQSQADRQTLSLPSGEALRKLLDRDRKQIEAMVQGVSEIAQKNIQTVIERNQSSDVGRPKPL